MDYSGLSYDRLRGPTGIAWPVNEQAPDGTDRLYTDPVFPTDTDQCETYGHDLLTGGAVTEQEHRAIRPAGRAFLKGAAYTPAHEEPSEDQRQEELQRQQEKKRQLEQQRLQELQLERKREQDKKRELEDQQLATLRLQKQRLEQVGT